MIKSILTYSTFKIKPILKVFGLANRANHRLEYMGDSHKWYKLCGRVYIRGEKF